MGTPARLGRFMNHHLDGILFNTPDAPPDGFELQTEQLTEHHRLASPGDPHSPQGILTIGSMASPKKPLRPEAPDWLEIRIIQFTLTTTIVMGTLLMHMIAFEAYYAQDELQLIGLTAADNSSLLDGSISLL
jgi:hypothetical protein